MAGELWSVVRRTGCLSHGGRSGVGIRNETKLLGAMPLVSFKQYGIFAEYLVPYVDMKGDIPEEGDSAESFWYPDDRVHTASDWAEWVRRSEAALFEVEQLIDAYEVGALRVCDRCGLPYDHRDDEGMLAYRTEAERMCLACWSGTGPLDFPGTYPAEKAARKVAAAVKAIGDGRSTFPRDRLMLLPKQFLR